MPKLILAFVGPLASGKGTCCQYLKERYGAPTYRFSTILRDILNRLHRPVTRGHLQLLSKTLRDAFGDDVLAQAVADDVAAEANAQVSVDGVRRLPDIRHLRRLTHFHLVAVIADERIRYERLTQRRENADDERKTFADFVADGQQEAERQIAEVVARADFSVDNNGTFDELYRQLDEIVRKLT